MAGSRKWPYSQFKFRVEIERGPGSDTLRAGFQEVSGLGIGATAVEHRAREMEESTQLKRPGMHKSSEVTLKRGVIGDLSMLHEWIRAVREGSQGIPRKVRIILQSEDNQDVQEWHLTNTRPTKYTGPSLSARGTDVAIEELVLACERIDLA